MISPPAKVPAPIWIVAPLAAASIASWMLVYAQPLAQTVSGFAADAERAPDSAAPASPTTSAVASSRRRRLLWTLVFRSLEERLAARTPTVERECAAAEAERDH